MSTNSRRTRLGKSIAGAGAEENSRAAVVIKDPRSSGKKRGAAIIIGEEEWRGYRHQGRRGAAAVVIREDEGRGHHHQRSAWLREEGLGAALLARVRPGKNARGEEVHVGEKGGQGRPFYP
jgi:hypothetical protein